MGLQIPEEKMAVYRETARRRQAEKERALAERWERAWIVARRAAALLKEEYGATRVVVFGSLVNRPLFHARSDVDLAAWGLDEMKLYHIVGKLLLLEPGIEVDLVRVEEARPSLRNRIEREGIML